MATCAAPVRASYCCMYYTSAGSRASGSSWSLERQVQLAARHRARAAGAGLPADHHPTQERVRRARGDEGDVAEPVPAAVRRNGIRCAGPGRRQHRRPAPPERRRRTSTRWQLVRDAEPVSEAVRGRACMMASSMNACGRTRLLDMANVPPRLSPIVAGDDQAPEPGRPWSAGVVVRAGRTTA